MSRHNRPFRFKQFEVFHHRSSMKIGVDAVILGSWADFQYATSILDAGCGCGVISLMAAQRNKDAKVFAIDIDAESVDESNANFSTSPWCDRLSAELSDFTEFCGTKAGHSEFDYIVSNPPYFSSGIETPESIRLKARHQGTLSPHVILEKGRPILSAAGRIGMVVPFDQIEELKTDADNYGLFTVRSLIMAGRTGLPPKRVFMEFSKLPLPETVEYLAIENTDGTYSDEYVSLCKDFYLKF